MLLHYAAEERGFAHPRTMLDGLTSSELSDLFAFYHIKGQGEDYHNAPRMMSQDQVKGALSAALNQRKKHGSR